jgi:hypothetical protein
MAAAVGAIAVEIGSPRWLAISIAAAIGYGAFRLACSRWADTGARELGRQRNNM